jgi:hypothetical protein
MATGWASPSDRSRFPSRRRGPFRGDGPRRARPEWAPPSDGRPRQESARRLGLAWVPLLRWDSLARPGTPLQSQPWGWMAPPVAPASGSVSTRRGGPSDRQWRRPPVQTRWIVGGWQKSRRRPRPTTRVRAAPCIPPEPVLTSGAPRFEPTCEALQGRSPLGHHWLGRMTQFAWFIQAATVGGASAVPLQRGAHA